jgi:hypothetical protein
MTIITRISHRNRPKAGHPEHQPAMLRGPIASRLHGRIELARYALREGLVTA